VAVNDVGEVNAACEGKNAWDRCIRDLVPKILDMSVVEWSKQKPQAVKKLKEALDGEFEYLGQPLSMAGFRAAITRYLKSERNRLKSKWLQGCVDCPLHVDDDQWDRLIEYWQTPAQQLKSHKMQEARQNVKNYALVGRKGKLGKDPAVVSYFFSCIPHFVVHIVHVSKVLSCQHVCCSFFGIAHSMGYCGIIMAFLKFCQFNQTISTAGMHSFELYYAEASMLLINLCMTVFVKREGGPSSPGITDMADIVRRNPAKADSDTVRACVLFESRTLGSVMHWYGT
jgi:hypothetical protein